MKKNVIKGLLMMKLTILLILAFSLQSFGKGYAQDNISLKLDKAQLKKAFKAIEEQGVFRFVYKDEIIPRTVRISIDVKEKPLNEVLDLILENTTLTYRRMSGNLVVITNKAANMASSGDLPPPA